MRVFVVPQSLIIRIGANLAPEGYKVCPMAGFSKVCRLSLPGFILLFCIAVVRTKRVVVAFLPFSGIRRVRRPGVKVKPR